MDTSYVVVIVFPNFLRQQTSHIQQASPTSGGLNSFVLPIHKWVPLLLQYEVMPQGEILTRLTGSDFLIQFFLLFSMEKSICLLLPALQSSSGLSHLSYVGCCRPFPCFVLHSKDSQTPVSSHADQRISQTYTSNAL